MATRQPKVKIASAAHEVCCRVISPGLFDFMLRKHELEEPIQSESVVFMDASLADLEGIDLRGRNLRSADFRGSNLRYADFTGASINYAKLEYADLRGAKGLTLDGLLKKRVHFRPWRIQTIENYDDNVERRGLAFALKELGPRPHPKDYERRLRRPSLFPAELYQEFVKAWGARETKRCFGPRPLPPPPRREDAPLLRFNR